VITDYFTCEPLANGDHGLRLAGELDVASARELRAALDGINGKRQATLDLAELSFIDSSGLHAIIQYANGNGAHGPLVLTNVPEPMLRIFKITGLDASPTLEIRTAK
jgi:anti-anti-sigma factor